MDFLKTLFGQDSVPVTPAEVGKAVVKSGITVGSAIGERVSSLIDDMCHISFD